MRFFVVIALVICSVYSHSIGSAKQEDLLNSQLETDLSGLTLSVEEWQHIKDVVMASGRERNGVIELDLTRITNVNLRILQLLLTRAGYDPLELQDHRVSITGSNFDLENGSLGGLSTFGISDAVIARFTLRTGILEITYPLAFDRLLVRYDYSTRVGLISASGDITAEVTDFRLELRLGFDFSTLYAFVDDADIRNTGSIDVQITGLGHLEYISDLISDAVANYFQEILLEAINLAIQIPINSVVNSINEAIDEALGRNTTVALYS